MTSGFCATWLSNLSLADVSVSYLLACVWSSNKFQLSEGTGCCRGSAPMAPLHPGSRAGNSPGHLPHGQPSAGHHPEWHKPPLTPGIASSLFSSKVTHSLPLGDEKENLILSHYSATSLLFPALSKPLLLLTKIISHLHFLLALLNYMCLHLLQYHKAE